MSITILRNKTASSTSRIFQYDGIDRLTTIISAEGGTKALTYATAVNPWANNIASIIDTPSPARRCRRGLRASPTTVFQQDDQHHAIPWGWSRRWRTIRRRAIFCRSWPTAVPRLHFNATSSFRYDAYGHVMFRRKIQWASQQPSLTTPLATSSRGSRRRLGQRITAFRL